MKRLVLFDVDGTLISAKGAGKRALARALVKVFGRTGPLDRYDFHGKTDPQIVSALMAAEGLHQSLIDEKVVDLFTIYLALLQEEVGDGRQVEVFPGIRALLDRLVALPPVTLGLLTGNLEGGARAKLSPTGLWGMFQLGAYGSDDKNRDHLPAIAAERAGDLLGEPVSPGEMVIVGDTPLDIQCARAYGARVVAVATGRHSVKELAEYRPDHLFPDLWDTERVVTALLDGEANPG